jgi:hypothetical protein
MRITPGYFQSSRKVALNPSLCGGRKITAEFFPAAFDPAAAPWIRMRDDFVLLSREIYRGKVKGDPPGYTPEKIARFLRSETASNVGIIWEEDTFRGFAITRELITRQGHAFYFVLTIISPEMQRMKVATYLQTKLGDDFMADRGLSKTLVSFDTPNPVVAGTITKFLLDPFPDPRQSGKKGTPEIMGIAEDIVACLYPAAKFDFQHFVLRDWYRSTPGLLYLADKVPRYGEDSVNAFCFSRLRLAEEKGDKMLFIGWVEKEAATAVVQAFESFEL